jgi:hypothetical protein
MENTLKVKVRKIDNDSVYGVTEDYRFSAIAHDKWELKQLMEKETSMKLEMVDMFQAHQQR